MKPPPEYELTYRVTILSAGIKTLKGALGP